MCCFCLQFGMSVTQSHIISEEKYFAVIDLMIKLKMATNIYSEILKTKRQWLITSK